MYGTDTHGRCVGQGWSTAGIRRSDITNLISHRGPTVTICRPAHVMGPDVPINSGMEHRAGFEPAALRLCRPFPWSARAPVQAPTCVGTGQAYSRPIPPRPTVS